MKTLLFMLLVSTFVYPTGTSKTSISTAPPAIIVQSTDSIDFKTMIQPIFEKRCNPCHFPGGKMYEKMPFDNPKTILNHEAGILRRIKADEEVELVKQFINSNKS
jgi:hypothetical protein